jgi:hypothetical protein
MSNPEQSGEKACAGHVAESKAESSAQFIERVRSMSSDERAEYMVAAGIYTRDGKLTSSYSE